MQEYRNFVEGNIRGGDISGMGPELWEICRKIPIPIQRLDSIRR
jgi:hypothetical protein